MTDSPPLLMTLKDVAELLGVSLSTVRRAMDSGALQSTRPGPKVLRFTRAQVNAWLASTSTSNQPTT